MGLFEYWPYSNFHELNADWLLNRVKQMSEYLNNLPDLVQDWISEGLSDIDINQKILDAMTQFGMAINVVAPPNDLDPAKPDGSEEATTTIQGCIDYAYAQGGGVVFFPAGRYLTGPLTLKDKVVLLGFADECTKLALKGGSTSPLITANGSNMAVMGLTLDGNAEVQTEDLTLVSMMATDVDYRDVTFTGGFILLSHNLTGGACNVLNCHFKTCVQHAAVFTGAGNLNVVADFDNLSETGGESVIENHVDNANMNIRISATAPVGLDLEADECAVTGWIGTGVTTPIKDEGIGNYVKVFGNIKKEAYKNKYVDIDGDYVVNDGDFTHTSENQTMTAATKVLISGQDVEIDSTNPMTYKTPETLNNKFKYIPFKDTNNVEYKVLIEGDFSNKTKLINILDLGADPTGINDCSEIINAATENYNIYMPSGIYKISSPITLKNSLFGDVYNAEAPTLATKIISGISEGTLITLNGYAINVKNIWILCNQNENAIEDVGHNTTTLTNILITNLKNGTGIIINRAGSRAAFIDEVSIFSDGTHNNTGLKFTLGGDCRITNACIMGCQTAIYTNSLIYISDSHFWAGGYGGETFYNTSVCINANNSNIFLSNCYIDTFKVAFNANNSRFAVTNIIMYYDNSVPASITNGQIFRTTDNKSKCTITGGKINDNGKNSVLLSGCKLSNVMINTTATDIDSQYMIAVTPETVKMDRSQYNIASNDANVKEIARIAKNSNMFLNITDSAGNVCNIYVSNASRWKDTINGTINCYFKAYDNWIVLYYKPAGAGYLNISVRNIGTGYVGNILYDFFTINGTEFPRESLETEAGLTEITEKA